MAELTTWVPTHEEDGFGIENLPYGVADGIGPVVPVGAHAVDLGAVERAGLLAGTGAAPGTFDGARSLNPFLEQGKAVWSAVRARLVEILTGEPRPDLLLHLIELRPVLPVEVGDYVDFYSSIEHATNLGRMFRPDGEPLLPNWRHLPVGYHGRSGTVVVSGTPIVRPWGQSNADDANPAPVFGPSRLLDIELEVGFVTGGPANPLGEPIAVDEAEDHIFGLVLLNDWSARDIQRWEYQPLGPFLGKSFATTISPWVVPLEALAPYRCAGPAQDPDPLPHLRQSGDRALDLKLEVWLDPGRGAARRVSATSFRGIYWSMAQQLAHATSNGAVARPGDLFASGTVSGSEPGTEGSFIELTWRGTRPLDLGDGVERSFLQDGDTVVLRGWCGGDGRPIVSFGDCTGTILPSR